MDDGRDQIAHITEEHGGDGVRAWRSRTRAAFLGLLHSCDESPVLLLGEVTPRGIMEYAMGCRRLQGRQGYLSKSAYGQICATVFHLFRVHNGVGFSENFHKELGNYFRGFYHHLTQQPPQQEAIGEPLQTGGGVGAVVVNPAPCRCRINKEGKDPMSVDLYKKLCGWLLDWNTNDGVFGHCFLVLTWNLSCRDTTQQIFGCVKLNGGVHLMRLKFILHIRRQTRQVMRQNTLVTYMLTLSVLLSVLCFRWLFIFHVVVTYCRLGSPGCSRDGTSIKGFRRCYLV